MPGARCTVPNHAFAGMTKLPLMLGHTWGHSRLQTSEIPQVVFFLRNRSHESLTTHTKARHGANADQPARTGFISTSRPGVPFLPRVGGRGTCEQEQLPWLAPEAGPTAGTICICGPSSSVPRLYGGASQIAVAGGTTRRRPAAQLVSSLSRRSPGFCLYGLFFLCLRRASTDTNVPTTASSLHLPSDIHAPPRCDRTYVLPTNPVELLRPTAVYYIPT
jgi:hypothetical protein